MTRFVTWLLAALFLLILGPVSQAHERPTPVIRSEFVFSEPLPQAPHCHASTIVATPEGLLCAWAGGFGEKDPLSKIYVSHRKKGSTHWSPPAAIPPGAPGKVTQAVWNPVLYRFGSSALLLFFKQGQDPRLWHGMLSISRDDGNSWSIPKRLPTGILGPIKDKPLKLADGTLLCPTSVQTQSDWRAYIEKIKPKTLSDFFDRVQWSRTGPLNPKATLAIQPVIMALDPKTLLLLCRSKEPNPLLNQSILSAVSYDNGNHWTNVKPLALPNPNSGIDAVALHDGRLALVYNPSRFRRTPLVLALSLDHGITWKKSWTLENGFGEYSYPAIIQGDDGILHITYTWKRSRIKYVAIDPQGLETS